MQTYFSPFKPRISFALCFLASFVTACGGGGSDGGQSFKLTADRQTVNATAKKVRGQSPAGPTESVRLTVEPTPRDGLFAFATHTSGSAIDLSSITSLNDSQAELLIRFSSPDRVEVGEYEGSIRVDVCSDEACDNPIQGSPLLISALYTVSEADDPVPISPEADSTWMDLGANDMIFNAADGYIYATISGDSVAAQYRNEVVAIDPNSKTVVNHAFAGSEPLEIAVSDDGTKLYVGMDGATQIKRFSLPALTTDLTITIPRKTDADGSQKSLFATGIAVAPGHPTTFAAALSNHTTIPAAEDVVIYDDSTPRENSLTSLGRTTRDVTSISFGESDTLLYGIDDQSTARDLSVIQIDSNGIAARTIYENLINGSDINIYTDGGLIYTDLGEVVDPSNGQAVGSYSLRGDSGFIPNTADIAIQRNGDRVYAIFRKSDEPENYATLREYDKASYTVLRTVSVKAAEFDERVNSINHEPLVQYGQGQLAFIFTGGNGEGTTVKGRIVFIDSLDTSE